MIKIIITNVVGWDDAIDGMRNPMNSWNKSDSFFSDDNLWKVDPEKQKQLLFCNDGGQEYAIGPDDQALMKRLSDAGPVHGKFKRMILVYMNIVAPLYWWKEFDTYKVGTVANSCSTMHKIHEKEFDMADFSTEHLYTDEYEFFKEIINMLNGARELYLSSRNKNDWWQMIQLLPSSYNQMRTIMLNYEVLTNIYESRKDHKLDEWREFCHKMKTLLPFPYLFTGKEKEVEDD